jgi:hypothetical protein
VTILRGPCEQICLLFTLLLYTPVNIHISLVWSLVLSIFARTLDDNRRPAA